MLLAFSLTTFIHCYLTVASVFLNRMMAGDCKSNSIPEDELQIRREEEQLFASIAAPPQANGVASLLEEDEDETTTSEPETKKKQSRTKKS
jgi:hypothetical protein